jgi:hypothetical protein
MTLVNGVEGIKMNIKSRAGDPGSEFETIPDLIERSKIAGCDL